MKKTLLLLVVGICSIWYSSADDCHLFNEGDPFHDNYKNQLITLNIGNKQKENTILKVLPKEALELAFKNLHAYCCASQKANSNICNKPNNQKNWKERKNFPESSYLFDHLMDIQLRRWLHNSDYPGLPKDPEAEKRYKNLEKNITDPEGKLPTTFNKEYEKFRGMQNWLLLPNYQDGMNTNTYKNLIEDIAEDQWTTDLLNQTKIKNFAQWNLRTKILNSCAVASYLTILLSSDKNLSSTLHSAQNSCKLLANQEIQKQHNMLKQAITFKSDALIQNTLNEYAWLYFWQKLNHLQNKSVENTTYLQWVMRQVTKLIPKCS